MRLACEAVVKFCATVLSRFRLKLLSQSGAEQGTVRFGEDFELDRRTGVLRRGDRVLKLERIPTEILLLLIEQEATVVSREQIVERIWGKDVYLDTDNSINGAVRKIRHVLKDNPERPRYIQTVTGKGYRFIAPFGDVTPLPAPTATETQTLTDDPAARQSAADTPRKRTWILLATLLAIVAVITFGLYWHRLNRAVTSNGRDPLIVAEFANFTGDPDFDQVLREVTEKELDRSPVIEVVDDGRVAELVRSASKTSDAPLTPELARQVCDLGKGKLLAEGAIKPRGSAYVIELTAMDCTSGRVLSHERAESKNLDEVLATTARLAAATRQRLSGDSVIGAAEPAALLTRSVPAYKAYLTGYGLMHRQDVQASAMLQKATQLDPGCADAWAWLAIVDRNLGEGQRADAELRQAFALRNKSSGNMKYRIEGTYYLDVTGEVYKAIDALQSWENLDPDAFPPHNLLGIIYAELSLYPKSTGEMRLALAVKPDLSISYSNLAATLQAQGEYGEANAVMQQAQNRGLHEPNLNYERYELALLRSDIPELEQVGTWMVQNADDPFVVSMQAKIDLFEGNLSRGRQRTQHAVGIALESNLKESAAEMLLTQANVESLFGESAKASKDVAAAMKLAASKTTRSKAARVMALNGQSTDARRIMDRLVHDNRSDTFLVAVDAPVVLAASQLESGQAELALQTLEPVRPYEFGWRTASFLPNYLRAMAFLKLRKPVEAAAEFKAVLEHRGVEPMAPTWELSQLGLARAYAMQGEAAKAGAAYRDFFGLCKYADSDIPVLREAKVEYARLK